MLTHDHNIQAANATIHTRYLSTYKLTTLNMQAITSYPTNPNQNQHCNVLLKKTDYTVETGTGRAVTCLNKPPKYADIPKKYADFFIHNMQIPKAKNQETQNYEWVEREHSRLYISSDTTSTSKRNKPNVKLVRQVTWNASIEANKRPRKRKTTRRQKELSKKKKKKRLYKVNVSKCFHYYQ